MATIEDLTSIATTNTYDYGNNHTDYYDDDYENQLCDKTSVNELGSSLTPIVLSIVVILSLFGNILVIVILAKYENLKSLTNAFILNLAVSDLFFTSGLPFWAYYHMYEKTLGDIVCKTINFIFSIGFYSSGILLILMTIHRYVAVLNPLSGLVSITGCYSVLTCVAVWTVSVLVASPSFIFTEVQNQNRCVYANSNWTLFGIYQQNILFVISSLVFIFCYSQIICRLLRPTAQKRKNKTLKLIFMLMVVFFVGWTPYNVVIFLKSFSFWLQPSANQRVLFERCEESKRLDYALNISRLVAFSHCCLNPVFYVFVGVKFKTHLKKMLKGWSKDSNSIRNRHSRLTITSLTSGDEFSM